jgi:hypothetical protein
MNSHVTKLPLTVVVAGVAAIALLWSGRVTPGLGSASFLSTASAWVGRPATPVSVAGVARRTTRRTVARHYPAPYPYR